jgi:hypothetical protein
MNFVFSEWEFFCSEVLSINNCIRADEIPKMSPNCSWVCIKHDVETDVSKAYELAKIENKYGIQATYFVQSYLLEENTALLKKILDLGHEVTYHYDVLDSNDGNFELALEEFTKTIKRFEELGFPVNTVCPHGNPLMVRDGWKSNKDFFRNDKVASLFPQIFDVVVQASQIIKRDFVYISDAGYSWKLIGNVDTNDVSNIGDIEIANSREVLGFVRSNENIIISSHPHRWCKSNMSALFQVAKFKIIRLVAKKLSKMSFFKKLMSKFYYLAKKI